jgi:hypothetical protein
MQHDLITLGAIFFCGLALVPSAAHALELPNKIHLTKDEYFVTQKLYRGWQRVAPIVILALFCTAVLAVRSITGGSGSKVASIAAFLSIAGTQIVFWAVTFPANRATNNWTHAPAHWELLRRKWEYSHAASAVLNLVAFASAVPAVP